MPYEEILSKAYMIADWKDNPWDPKGRERYLRAIKEFKTIIKHPWLNSLLSKNSLLVLDIGAGRGIGGVALAKALMEKGVRTNLVMIDLRRDAIQDAKRFAQEEGVKAKGYVMNALEEHKLGKFDIVLMYGAILVHFNEWELPRLFASSASALTDDGIVIIQEMDRVHAIFRGGFKELVIENTDPEKLSISYHLKYDLVTASYYRVFVRLKDYETAILPINFRSIAHLASTLWLFTKDVDILPTGAESIYFILGKSPRKTINPEDLGVFA